MVFFTVLLMSLECRQKILPKFEDKHSVHVLEYANMQSSNKSLLHNFQINLELSK